MATEDTTGRPPSATPWPGRVRPARLDRSSTTRPASEVAALGNSGPIAMGRRGRLFRGRSSYKASDVAALFLIGLLLGAICYGILTALVWVIEHVFVGRPRP